MEEIMKGLVRILRSPVINCYSTTREDHDWTITEAELTHGDRYDIHAVWGYVEEDTIINEHVQIQDRCYKSRVRSWPINPLEI
jgi:hypothetical protein